MFRNFILMMAAPVLAMPAWARTDVKEELEALKKEPSVREVQEAALRYFRVNMDKVSSMRAGAAWKAVMPVIEVSGGKVQSEITDDTVNQEWDPTEVWNSRGVTGNAWEIRGKATWNLPQLVFNPEELDVASLAGLMEGILKESTRLYYMRRRLQVDMLLTPPRDAATRITKELRMEELTGLMDAMTGGWFQKELDRRMRGITSEAD